MQASMTIMSWNLAAVAAMMVTGWFVTEIGRQPYIVYEVLRTSDTVSPVIGTNIALSLLAFIVTYTFVFGAGSYYILRLIGKGPEASEKAYGDHGIKAPPLVTDLRSETGGGKNV
jgi:cytochrome d ubiquinol oxidase subunit I